MKKTKFLFASLLATTLFLGSCGAKKEEGEKTEGAEATEETAEGSETASEGTEFTSEAGKFTIKFAAKPAESEEDVPTEIGNVKMYMFMHEASATKVYMVAYCDYPSELVAKADAAEMLQGSKEGVVGKFSATIKDEKASKFQGHECLDFTAGGPQYHTAYKLVLADNRLYQVGILQDGSEISQEDIDTFIGSFKITEEKAAE